MSRLTARFGARVPPVEADPVEVRTLIEMAVENAIEGCVRETYGAAVAAFQGEWAGDRAVRLAIRAIAADEAEHASLGWDVDAWARTRLRPAEVGLVEAARESARDRLLAAAQDSPPIEAMKVLGLPGPAAAARLTAALAPLWS